MGKVAKPPARILVVDDDDGTLETYARGLRLLNYEVVAAQGTEAGWQEISARRPDAILLDLRMPPPDGLDFLRRLRGGAETRDTPVAIITGDYLLNDLVTPRQIAELGATVYFKPLWLEELTSIVRTLLNEPPPRG